MLQYTASEKYQRDNHVIHFVLMGVFAVIVIIAAIVYFS